jgi:hypothetical protein
MDKRFLMGTAAIIIVAAIALGITYSSLGTNTVNVGQASAFVGRLTVTVEKPTGTTTYEVHNTVMLIGMTRVIDFLENGANGMIAADNKNSSTTFISLSNDATPVNTWTNLPNELGSAVGLQRENGAMTYDNTTQYHVSYKFTCSAASTLVQCAGLNWENENASASLWAAATFTQVTLNANDNITITWTVQHT